jgi:hypothetical protein
MNTAGRVETRMKHPPNGLEQRSPAVVAGSCPAEAGGLPPLYATPAGGTSCNLGPARWVSRRLRLGQRSAGGPPSRAFRRWIIAKVRTFLDVLPVAAATDIFGAGYGVGRPWR